LHSRLEFRKPCPACGCDFWVLAKALKLSFS
jgi:hypothetical protein